MSSFCHPGTVLTDRSFLVPLDHSRPEGDQIEVFAREVVAADKAGQAEGLPWSSGTLTWWSVTAVPGCR